MAIVGATMQIAFWSIIIPVAILVMRFLFSEIFYIIGILFFGVIDILQSVFRKLAGLDVVYYGSKAVNGDILTSILRSQIVMDTMIAVAVFAIALVIIATIVQMIRTEYTTEGSKNSKESIFAKGLKSLVMFILIPVVCFFGIRVSNYLLQAIDYATSSTGSRSLSGAVFAASVVDANRISANMEGEFSITDITITNLLVSLFAGDKQSAHMGKEGGRVYVKGFKETLSVTDANNDSKNRSNLGKKIDELMTMPSDTAKTANSGGYGDGILVTGKLNYMNITAVSFFYAFSKMNFLIMYVGAFMVLQALFNASMGMVVRMYKVTALFILAPAAIGLQPLDDGAAYKKWRTGFISNVLSAYGVIIALNLFFAIAGVVSGISLWDPENPLYYTLNKFMQALFVVVGATQIKGLAKMIGEMIGAANAMEEGQAAVGEVGKLAASAGKFAGGVAKGGAFFANKGNALRSRVQASRTKRQLRDLDNDTTMSAADKETKRKELSAQLNEQEAARQIYTGRAKGLFADSGAGKMIKSVTGGVKSVIDNTAYSDYDDKTVAGMKKNKAPGAAGIVNAAENKLEADEKAGKARVNKIRNFAMTGGLTGAAAFAAGAGGFIGGTVSGAVQSMYNGSRVGQALNDGLKRGDKWARASGGATFDATNKAVNFAYEGDRSLKGEKTSAVASFHTAKVDAETERKQTADIARSQVDSQVHSVISGAEKSGSSHYNNAKRFATRSMTDIDSALTSGNISTVNANVQRLFSSSDNGSEMKAFAQGLKDILDPIIAGGRSATTDEEAAMRQIFNNADRDYLSKEYGARHSETKDEMKNLFGQKVDIDKAEVTAQGDIEKATNSNQLQPILDELSKALAKTREEGDVQTQGHLADLLSKGITVRGTDGEPLKVDSKQFVDAIKDLKASVEAQNNTAVQKDISKTLQDLLKETKKKK